MTIENAKVSEIGKGVFFSNWTDSKRILGPETDENEIQNCKSLEQNTQNSLFLVFAAVNKSITSVKSINFVDNVLLNYQKGQVVHSLLCHGRAQDKFDSLHTAEDSFSCDSGILYSLTLVIC